MNRTDYWEEAITNSFEAFGIIATEEQIAGVAGDMDTAHECEDMAFGDDVADANLQGAKNNEIAQLRRQLVVEREKVPCGECGGLGRIVVRGPSHNAESECWKCRGEGRHAP